MTTLLHVLKKDLLIELRSKHVLSLLLLLSLLLSVVLGIGVQTASLRQEVVVRIFPALWWATFVFSATLAIGRSHDYETEEGALEALLVSNVSTAALFASKCIVNVLSSIAGQLASLLFLAVLLNVDVMSALPALSVITVLISLAYASLATLLVGLTSTSSLKHLLLPLILLPLVTPLFMGATELTMQQLEGRGLDLTSPWVSLLAGLDVVYFLAGLNLYGVVVRD